jgi:DTW domain-containing protein YfiP
MSRSVVLSGTERCERCMLPLRWCVCDAVVPVRSDLCADILLHTREQWRPTSTGRLIERALAGARTHIYRRTVPIGRETLAKPGREMWILHPRGGTMPAERLAETDPAKVQVLLIDGSWGEASRVLTGVEHWGQTVRLPLAGGSRYWLREQQGEGNLSTVETLIGLLELMGRREEAGQLRLHFELHVYAALRSRGRKALAEEYLSGSPIRDALPTQLEKLHERRPNTESEARRGMARGERWGRIVGAPAREEEAAAGGEPRRDQP